MEYTRILSIDQLLISIDSHFMNNLINNTMINSLRISRIIHKWRKQFKVKYYIFFIFLTNFSYSNLQKFDYIFQLNRRYHLVPKRIQKSHYVLMFIERSRPDVNQFINTNNIVVVEQRHQVKWFFEDLYVLVLHE